MATRWNKRNVTVKIEEMQEKHIQKSNLDFFTNREKKGRMPLKGLFSAYKMTALDSDTLAPGGTITVTTVSGRKYFETFNNRSFSATSTSTTITNYTKANRAGIVVDLTAAGTMPVLFRSFFGVADFSDLRDEQLLCFSDQQSGELDTITLNTEDLITELEESSVFWDMTAVPELDREYAYEPVGVTWDMTMDPELDRS